MEVKIIEERENPFFKRIELKILVIHKKMPTPKKEDILKLISELKNVDKDKIKIEFIFSKKGKPESLIKAKILK